MISRLSCLTILCLLSLMSSLAAGAVKPPTITDTGYQEMRAGKDIYLQRHFTIDTGKRTFKLQSDGASIGMPGGSWHANELFIITTTDEKYLPEQFLIYAAGKKEDFQEKITFTTAKENGRVALQGETKGRTANIKFELSAAAGDEHLTLRIHIEPLVKLVATEVGMEAYPNAGGPQHKLQRGLTTATRTHELAPEDPGRRDFMLNADESWVLLHDMKIDLNDPTQGDQVAHGPCALVYQPSLTSKARIRMSNTHEDPRFTYGPEVKEMEFLIFDFPNMTNAQALEYMRAFTEKGMKSAPDKQTPKARPSAMAAPASAPDAADVAPAATPATSQPQAQINPVNAADMLVSHGQSPYVIYYAADAPSSVVHAAAELQRVIRIAAGVTLPIQTTPARLMICLGDNPSAREAGFAAESLHYEHFRIRRISGNVYIVGRDTADGQLTQWSGVSRGTAYGVQRFMEVALQARWIMPSELGEIIPTTPDIALGDLDIEDGPAFAQRSLYLPTLPVNETWLARYGVSVEAGNTNRITAMSVDASHSWPYLMPTLMLEHHPQWLAQGGDNNKFCTRHPQALQTFKEQAIHWIDQHPAHRMISASPSDGQGYCRCPECSSHIEYDAHGQESFTINMLDLYNELARTLSIERPGHMVGGYAYGKITYPPNMPYTLQPNVHILWTPLNYYGLGLYKPRYRDEFEKVARQWRQLTPNLSYWCYHYWHRSDNGAPLAPATRLMAFQFPILARHGFQGVIEEGISNWAYGGPTNYLLVHLMWNPHADVEALFNQWLTLAYGNAAAPMKNIYTLLDERFKQFKENQESFTYHGDNYEVKSDKIVAIYLPVLDQIEKMYKEALTADLTERQRQRVEMFGDNLIIFHFHLRQAGYLGKGDTAAFLYDEKEYSRFLSQLPNLPRYLSFPEQGRLLASLLPLPLKPVDRPGDASFTAERRSLRVPMVGQATMELDGRIDQAQWQQAAVADNFRQRGGGASSQSTTIVRVLADQETLYIAAECHEELVDYLVAPPLPDNSPQIFNGNTFEVFLTDAKNPQRIIHLAVDEAGNRWAGVGNQVQPITWRSAVAKGDRLWTVEIALPLASLGIESAVETKLRANLARTAAGQKSTSTWNAVRKIFLEPDHFGTWELVSPPGR